MQNLVICYCAYAWQLDVFVKRNLRNCISTVKSVNYLKILFSQRGLLVKRKAYESNPKMNNLDLLPRLLATL